VLVFILRRLLALPLVMLAVTVLIVAVMQLLTPEQRAASFAKTPQQLQQLNHIIAEKGLDKSFVHQYWAWLSEAMRGNFGFSKTTSLPVLQTIRQRFPATLELTLYAALPIIGLGMWLGTQAAVHRGRLPDQVARFLSVVGYSVPSFVLAVWLLVVFYGGFDVLPGFGQVSNETTLALLTGGVRPVTGLLTLDALLSGQWGVFVDALRHLVLPVVTLVVVSSAQIVKGMRVAMIESLAQDYVRTAKAKGLATQVVHYKHARRNALITVATLAGFTVSGLLQGAVLVEAIFALPGIGAWGAKAAQTLDVPGVLGFALLTAFIVVLVNLLVDIAYALIDPRVRFD
jgi:ABC-type dipeptide/oligopeptide/nickel transport system permease component